MIGLIEKIKAAAEAAAADYLHGRGVAAPEVEFSRPSDPRYGHLATGAALKYAKELGQKPIELAFAIQEFVSAKLADPEITFSVLPPGFVNLQLSQRLLTQEINQILTSPIDYGRNSDLRGEKWVVEHTSPNPNKAMHLGHLRNNLIGMSLTRLFEWSGAEVVADAVDNNRGVAIAKLMWGFLFQMRRAKVGEPSARYWLAHQNEWHTPESLGLRPDELVSRAYVLGEEDYRARPEARAAVQALVDGWEAGDGAIRALWRQVLDYAYTGINRTLTRLGNRWDRVWHEHEHYERGKDWVAKGLEQGIFRRLEDGAVLTNLADYNLPDTVLLKSDGTSLYITQDIALTALKKQTYGAKRLAWVIGAEQTLALEQVFAVCEQLGIGRRSDFMHVSYGYVGLKAVGGFRKMSSRAGTVVLIDDLIDGVRERLRERAGDQAEALALAAVKFAILRPEREQNLVFDVERSIQTEGDSGVYAIYTYARGRSILRGRKVPIATDTIPLAAGDLPATLAFFPSVVRRARCDFSPHHLVQYLLQTCAEFNQWYGREKILDGSQAENGRLALVQATLVVIKNTLNLLGIEPLEKV